MRSKRVRRADDLSMFPTYELFLNPDEDTHATTKTLENIAIGAKLMVKCTPNGGEDAFERLQFRANNIDVGELYGTSKSLLIENFSASHVGIYECGAKRKSDGKYHSRQMRVTQKRSDLGLPSCGSDHADYCGDHGACVMDGPRKICHCDDRYMGEKCDKVLMAAYDVKLLKVVGGTTVPLNLLWILLAVLFAVLFVRERKAKIRMRREMEKGVQQEVRNLENVAGVEEKSFARTSFRKMRLAYNRARLNGTSDTKLINSNI